MNTLTHTLTDFVMRWVFTALACLNMLVCAAAVLGAGKALAENALTKKDEPATINIMASIEPLALMARSVGGNRVSVSTLLEAGVTPHDFSFRVSQRRQLAEADLVLWVGADLEPYLQGPLSNASARQHSLAMESLVNLKNSVHVDAHDEERDGFYQSHSYQSHSHQGDSLVGDAHTSHDPHLWLSRQAGQAMLLALAAKLSELDPANSPIYLHNAEAERQRLQALEVTDVGEKPRPYAASHSAFEYMLEEFHLPEPLVLSPSPEVAPSAKRLWQLRQTLKPDDCLLVSWPKPLAWQQKLADKNGYRLEVVDTMGYSEGVTTYSRLFETLLAQLHTCLKPN